MPLKMRFQKVVKPTVRHPARTAALAALVYVTLSGIYIVISGQWAASLADTPEQLQVVETYKGIAFVVFSGLLFFGISTFLLSSIRRREEVIIEQEMHLLQAERKDVAMMFASSIAHDINNYLMSLYGVMDGIKERAEGDEYLTSMLSALEKGSEKITRLARHMTSSVRREMKARQDHIDLHKSLPAMIELLRRHPSIRTLDIRHDELPSVGLKLNAFLFEEAVMNLLVNAGQAAGQRGELLIRCRGDDDGVTVEVHDSGPGVDPEKAEDIFQPGFTTKEGGTGLGLLAVKAFVASCNGEVTIGRSELGGAVFSLRIPQAAT